MLLPLGHRDILYIKSWNLVCLGGAPPPAPWVLFYFLKITLGTAVLAAGGICPSPCTTLAAWAGGRGGTVPVIIKHEFNYAHCLSALWPAPSGEGVWIGGQPPFQSWHCSTPFPVTGHPSLLFPCLWSGGLGSLLDGWPSKMNMVGLPVG